MVEKMKDIKEILLGIGIVSAVLVTLDFFLLNAGNINPTEILQIGIVIILVLSSIYILWDRIKNINRGLPAQDERLKLINYNACSYGFIASIWSAVGAPLISGIVFDYEIGGHYVTAAVVICGVLVFFISYLYLSWRGD